MDMSIHLCVEGSNPCPSSVSVSFFFSPQIRGSKPEAKVGWTNQPVEDERDCSSCDLEVMSQSLILPPTDRPYFLLLQGYDQSKARHADRSYRTQYCQTAPTRTQAQMFTQSTKCKHTDVNVCKLQGM